MEGKVEEVPGLYGGIRVEEKVIQRIWFQSEFITFNLVSEEGKKLSILNTGTWNRSDEGPDFRNAVICIGGRKNLGMLKFIFMKEIGEIMDMIETQIIIRLSCMFVYSPQSLQLAASSTLWEKKSRN